MCDRAVTFSMKSLYMKISGNSFSGRSKLDSLVAKTTSVALSLSC
ncbi:hypothetical protein NIES2104_16010 [Leptolyngbya sp. NIES-2104]|nr:hypothetical protein NIES2104_16010 [Leptolyngbya sp. NIES-2104]